MKTNFKKVMSAVLAVIMLLALCVPAFAAPAQKNCIKSNGLVVTITQEAPGFCNEGDVFTVKAKVVNKTAETKDIRFNFYPTAFAKTRVVIDGKLYDRTSYVDFKNVEPNGEREIELLVKTYRPKNPNYTIDMCYTAMMGKLTVLLYNLAGVLSENVIVTSFEFADVFGAVAFKAQDITPVPQAVPEA